ncbi:MAG: 3-deoxy-D-manno-octulosonic acid transferase [Saprospiraceae bacterium]|jgi:3-deoxy-D-manno-octulosonic-acid transferase|nr:3-deoxy-D-manno-octulosonic acid transferase [Saprospiraceae bacterium]
MFVLYTIAVRLYFTLVHLAACCRRDARRWRDGRKHWREKLVQWNDRHAASARPRIWFHASSLGEFEQGRTLMEIVREKHPDWLIMLSFYSPSGYDRQKNYPNADCVAYFPSDIKSEVDSWLELWRPDIAVFIKYDFWFELLQQLDQRRVPFFFISAIFRPNHYLLLPFAKRLLDRVMRARCIFVQDPESGKLLSARGHHNHELAGDTRVDRVLRMAGEALDPGVSEKLDAFCGAQRIFVAGSTWQRDLDRLVPAMHSAIARGWKCIIAPHRVSEDDLLRIERHFAGTCLRWSLYQPGNSCQVLAIDCIGLLAGIYRKGHFAYVGGGFSKGVHNLLEPAVHGLPVCFGPRHRKFPEAGRFVQAGFGFSIETADDLAALFTRFETEDRNLRQQIRAYFAQHSGASEKIYKTLKPLLEQWPKPGN